MDCHYTHNHDGCNNGHMPEIPHLGHIPLPTIKPAVKARIQIRQDSVKNWQKSTIPLLPGELALSWLEDGKGGRYNYHLKVGVELPCGRPCMWKDAVDITSQNGSILSQKDVLNALSGYYLATNSTFKKDVQKIAQEKFSELSGQISATIYNAVKQQIGGTNFDIKEFNNLSTYVNTSISAMSKDISSVKKDIKTLSSTVNSLNSSVKSLDGRVSENSKNISQLTKDVGGISKTLGDLQANDVKIQGEISKLSSDFDRIPGKIEELEKKIGDGVRVDLKDYVTKDESRTISSNIVSKAEEMDRNLSSNLQKRIDYVDEKVDSTYKEIVNIQSQIIDVKNSCDTYHIDIDETKKQLNKRIDDSNSKVDKFDEKLDRLIETNPAITGKVDVSNLTQRDPDEQILVIAGGNCTGSFDDDHDYTSEDI